ncbi:MAG TPA: hypothetical protein VGM54_03535 [Chthoniobacter sp.]|jgi:hypothetical protein
MKKAFVFLLGLVLFHQSASAQSIWFAPRAGRERPADYMDLFKPDAPWPQAASHVKVFELSQRMAAAGSETELRQIFSNLRDRHIGLCVGVLPLSAGPDGCGQGVEGYSAPGQSLHDAKRIQALGADVAAFALDEPLHFGHAFQGTKQLTPCHSPIDDIARQVALRVQQIRTVYPNAQVGDVEPFPGSDSWLAELEQWFEAYHKATGEKLAFFRLDMAWDRPWRERIPALVELLHREGIPLQVIYNGNGRAATDEEWIAQALSHAAEFESQGRPTPDVVCIQCWTPKPSKLLPETDPKTLTSLINQYVAQKTRK